MILSIWVYMVMGDPLATDHGTPYVQTTASATMHSTPELRDRLERLCTDRFHRDYPGHTVCDSGWCRQEVTVVSRA